MTIAFKHERMWAGVSPRHFADQVEDRAGDRVDVGVVVEPAAHDSTGHVDVGDALPR